MKIVKNNLRSAILATSVILGILISVLLLFTLEGGSYMGRLLIDKQNETISLADFFSVQAFMWIFFTIGLGELFLRLKISIRESNQLTAKLLPEEEHVILTDEDLPPLIQKVNESPSNLFLPRMIKRLIKQFQISKSVDQSNSLLNSSMELYLHEIELNYSMSRYIMWLIPTLGFIGTVMGIAEGLDIAALQYAENGANIDLGVITSALGVAFYTTLLALVMSSILVFMMQVIQGKEEGALNVSGQYCIDHLINKLYEDK